MIPSATQRSSLSASLSRKKRHWKSSVACLWHSFAACKKPQAQGLVRDPLHKVTAESDSHSHCSLLSWEHPGSLPVFCLRTSRPGKAISRNFSRPHHHAKSKTRVLPREASLTFPAGMGCAGTTMRILQSMVQQQCCILSFALSRTSVVRSSCLCDVNLPTF